jgi:hypothetical protein
MGRLVRKAITAALLLNLKDNDECAPHQQFAGTSTVGNVAAMKKMPPSIQQRLTIRAIPTAI